MEDGRAGKHQELCQRPPPEGVARRSSWLDHRATKWTLQKSLVPRPGSSVGPFQVLSPDGHLSLTSGDIRGNLQGLLEEQNQKTKRKSNQKHGEQLEMRKEGTSEKRGVGFHSGSRGSSQVDPPEVPWGRDGVALWAEFLISLWKREGQRSAQNSPHLTACS